MEKMILDYVTRIANQPVTPTEAQEFMVALEEYESMDHRNERITLNMDLHRYLSFMGKDETIKD